MPIKTIFYFIIADRTTILALETDGLSMNPVNVEKT